MKSLFRSLALCVLGLSLLYSSGAMALTSGNSVSGSVPEKPAVQTHTISASSGSYINLSIAASIGAYAYVYAPDGSYLGNASTSAYFSKAASTSGNYRVDVVAAFAGQTGSYTVHYANTLDANENGSISSAST